MIRHFTSIRSFEVLAARRSIWGLSALVFLAVASGNLKAENQRSGKSHQPAGASGPDPLKCQPFVVLYRMDLAGNRNGILELEEVPRGAESFVQRLVGESKMAAPHRTSLRDVAVAWHHRMPRTSDLPLKSKVIRPAPSSSTRRKRSASQGDLAANFLRMYDEDDDGNLEQSEWSRIGPGWNDADTDGNGVLSLDELSQRFGSYGQPESESEPKWTRARSTMSDPSQPRRSYRVRTAHERLPEGIPGWYIQKDADRDGQIMMVEYARAWNDEKLAEFNRYDANRDGIITPRECLKTEAKEINGARTP